MLIIRLQRTGTKNRPTFRLVLAQAYRSATKRFIEILGHYNPRSKEFGIKNEERLKYWIGQHVKLSPTVHNLLVEKKLMEGSKVKAWQPKKKEKPEGEAAAPAAPAAQAAPETPAETAPAAEAPAQTPEAAA
ncbi:MAG TPA: 30S ribosomal protein S16 [Candidatus Binatia bacterium]|nr:30S ribosomal protein S16 [Candidatus Binatia bacterium]